jgi:hypothetical protein
LPLSIASPPSADRTIVFWTWKIGNSTELGYASSPFWHYKLGLEQGWMPKDPRTVGGFCSALGVGGSQVSTTRKVTPLRAFLGHRRDPCSCVVFAADKLAVQRHVPQYRSRGTIANYRGRTTGVAHPVPTGVNGTFLWCRSDSPVPYFDTNRSPSHSRRS